MNEPQSAAQDAPLKILYDVSVLGLVECGQSAKTGIFRVVERVARHLARREELDVRWTAYQHPLYRKSAETMAREGRLFGRPLMDMDVSGWERKVVARACRTRFHRVARRAWPVVERIERRRQYGSRYFGQADVLHSPFYALPIPSRPGRGPVRVLTAYDLIPLKFPEWFQGGTPETVRLGFQTLTRRDWVVCISESTRNDLLEFRPDLDPDRVRVTPLAASDLFRPERDEERLAAARRRIGLPEGAPYFLSLCTLEPRKNIRHVLDAFAEVSARTDADPFLVLVGSKGWLNDDLLEEMAAIRRRTAGRERVIATGFLPDEDLPAIYTGATAFVYMSKYEGFGLPPLEALQCGTAVVTSDNSSLPEVVGDAGVMLPADDRDGLVHTMSRLLEDQGYRDALAAAGPSRAARFTWERCGEQTVQTYRDAAAAK